MKTQQSKYLIAIIAMIVFLALGIILIVIGAPSRNNALSGIGVLTAVYGVLVPVHYMIVEKYNAPKGLILLAIINIYGLVLLLILVYRPDGYANRSKMVRCPHCGGMIGQEFTICPYCRHETRPMVYTPAVEMPHTEAAVFCIYCGAANKADARYCSSCGAQM